MKRFLSIAIFSIALATACNTAPAEGSETVVANQEITLAVDGMTCEMGCKKAIEKTLQNLPGVAYAEVDYETKTAKVSFDNNLLHTDAVIQAVNESYNGIYSATPL
jgi:copper chaperone CopZ